MKRILGVMLVLACLGVWRFVTSGGGLMLVTNSPQPVMTSLETIVPGKEIVIRAESRDGTHRLTVISLTRTMATQLGVSAPAGFHEEALPLTPDERRDTSAVADAAAYNRETLRWAGELTLLPNAPQLLVIPATAAMAIDGVISLQYEAKHRLGGSISFGRVSLADSSIGRE